MRMHTYNLLLTALSIMPALLRDVFFSYISFCQAAAYKGFISRIIWIYPDWLHEDDTVMSETEVLLYLGHYYHKSRSNQVIGNCYCEVSILVD